MVMKKIVWILVAVLMCSFTLYSILEKGNASYYSSKFEGRKTASGAVFRQDSLTGAHKNLPFGTRVLVTNLKNDSMVIVTINDRLSPKSGHTIDLTLKAAKQLNFVRNGITQVTLQKIE
jgi:rare lipoprotein A